MATEREMGLLPIPWASCTQGMYQLVKLRKDLCDRGKHVRDKQ